MASLSMQAYQRRARINNINGIMAPSKMAWRKSVIESVSKWQQRRNVVS